MKFKDLAIEYVKTIMAAQRFVLFPNGMAVSIIHKEGTDGYLIQAYRHDFELDEPVDLFKSTIREWGHIDFKKLVFTSENTPRKFIDNTLEVLKNVTWHEPGDSKCPVESPQSGGSSK